MWTFVNDQTPFPFLMSQKGKRSAIKTGAYY